jgi:alanine racemase
LNIEEQLHAAGLPPLPRTAWLEIDTDALAANLTLVRRLIPAGTRIAAVVKADAYGHGLEASARTLREAGAEVLCGATIDEALALRQSGDRGAILLLYPIPGSAVAAAAVAGIELSVSSEEGAAETLAAWREAREAGGWVAGLGLRLHLEVETGMTRDGVAASVAAAVALRLAGEPGVTLAGVWSHLADPADEAFSAAQSGALEGVVQAVRRASPVGSVGPIAHLASSGGLLAGTAPTLAMVRPGLMLYGVAPPGLPLSPAGAVAARALRPVMSLKARAVRVVDVPVGAGVGYGRTWRAERPSRVATLPLGYGDGYARGSAPGAEALVRGRRVPLVGVISMDSLTIDVTDVPGMGRDDEVVLLGQQGEDSITATDLARQRTTIAWEVLSGMARRIPRVYDAATGPKGMRMLGGGPQNGDQRSSERDSRSGASRDETVVG